MVLLPLPHRLLIVYDLAILPILPVLIPMETKPLANTSSTILLGSSIQSGEKLEESNFSKILLQNFM